MNVRSKAAPHKGKDQSHLVVINSIKPIKTEKKSRINMRLYLLVKQQQISSHTHYTAGTVLCTCKY